MLFFQAVFVLTSALTATCMTIKSQDVQTNIEKRQSWTSIGCYTDNVSGRGLTTSVSVSGAMTNEGCQASCSAAGFSYAGTEYGGECCEFFTCPALPLPNPPSHFPTFANTSMNRVWQLNHQWKWTCRRWLQYGLQG